MSGGAGLGAVAERTWVPGRPVDVSGTLTGLRRGGGDPCFRRDEAGSLWRSTRTPEGPGLLRLRVWPAQGAVVATAWGPGAEWLCDGVPHLLGDADDPSGFTPLPSHPKLVAAWRTRGSWRVTRTRAVFEALVAAAIEQRVTGLEAHRSWRGLITAYGELAPGPARVAGNPATGMRVMPDPAGWKAIPSWAWLKHGVDEQRRRVVIQAARVAGRLERTLDAPPSEVEGLLRVVPGVGKWTAAEVRQRAHGDPDAFSFGDYHVAKNVTWALTGEVQDDSACAVLLEPYRGHRFRVQRLLELDGALRPRRAPRMTLPTHLPGIPS